MVHVANSLRALQSIHFATNPLRRNVTSSAPATTTAAGDASSAGTASPSTSTAPDFRALFTGTVTPAVPDPPQQTAPTAESVFGSNPWNTNACGVAPNGSVYAYNPYYFATAATAAKVAQMVGGTVVQSNQFTPNGGPFQQQQPNYMVRLADGRMINPGLVASFYTHGYPQSYVDQMVASEVRNA
jgi:hypothetical protein